MCGLMLVRPCKLYAELVMSYKEEMSQNGDSFDGCAGLEDVYSFDEWIDFEGRLRKKYKTGYLIVTSYRLIQVPASGGRQENACLPFFYYKEVQYL